MTDYKNLIAQLRQHEITLMQEAADAIEDLSNQLLTINPAIKCRSGCDVIEQRWGKGES